MLKQKFALDYGTQMIARIVGIISGILVARFAGPTVLGTLAFGMSFVSMFRFLTDLGLNTAHIKLVSEGQDLGQCNATFTRLKFASTLIFVIIVLSYLGLQKFAFRKDFETPEHLIVIFIWILITVGASFKSIPQSTFISKIERAKVDLPVMFQTILTKILRITIAALGFGAIALSCTNLFGIVLIIFLYFFLFRRYPFTKFDKSLAKKYFNYAIPLIFFMMASGMSIYIDRVLLQYFSNSTEVGYYSAGFSISSPTRLLGLAMAGLFFPVFSELFSNNNENRIVNLIKKYERFLILFILPLVVLFIMYASTFVPFLLSNKYINSIPVVMWVIAAMFIYILQLPYGNILMGAGKFKLCTVISVSNLVFLVLIITAMSSPYFLDMGARGTAIALTASNLFLFFVNICFSKKIIKNLKYINSIIPLLVETALFLIFYYIYSIIRQNFVLKIFIFPAFFLFTFYIVLYLVRIIKKNDFQELYSLVNIKDMWKYIKYEIKIK